MANPRRRWDTDTRGIGVRDATSALGPLARLGDAMRLEGWVAEDPELHLLPHLVEAAEALGIDIRRTRAVDGTFEVDVDRGGRSEPEVRAAALRLVGAIAEASTHVRQAGDGEFEVVTGMLPGDSQVFTTHGHLLLIRFV